MIEVLILKNDDALESWTYSSILGTINAISYCPQNSPSASNVDFDTMQEAFDELGILLNTGWEVVEFDPNGVFASMINLNRGD